MLHVLFPPVVAVVVDDVCSFWVAVAVPGSVVVVDWVVVDISTRHGGDWLDICGMDSVELCGKCSKWDSSGRCRFCAVQAVS